MDTLLRFLAGLGIAAALFLAFFFFATVGLVVAGIAAVAFIVSYFFRGDRKDSGSFRIYTIRTNSGDTSFHRETGEFRSLETESGNTAAECQDDTIVDIPPEDYRDVPSSETGTENAGQSDERETAPGGRS